MVARNKSRDGKDQHNETLITKEQASGSAKIDLLITAANSTNYRTMARRLGDVHAARHDEVTDGLLAKPEGRLDPNDMIARMIELIPDQKGPFRKAMLGRTI